MCWYRLHLLEWLWCKEAALWNLYRSRAPETSYPVSPEPDGVKETVSDTFEGMFIGLLRFPLCGPSKPYPAGFLSPVGRPAGHPRCGSLSAAAGPLPRSSHRRCRCRSCHWRWTQARWGTAWWCAQRRLFHGPSPMLLWYCREDCF